MLVLVFAESAIETIPKDMWRHPSVKLHSRKRGKPPGHLLLDRSYHHFAMRKVVESEKRGRPDIIHFSLLEALGSPLNKEGLLQVYVHTRNNFVITVNPQTRLPRNYDRFVGLLEQLYELGRVPPFGKTLLRLERKELPKLLREIRTDYVTAFSRKGTLLTVERAISRLVGRGKPAVIIGGFPKGHLSEEIIEMADQVVSVDSDILEAWTLTSRVVYEYERTISLPEKRLKQ